MKGLLRIGALVAGAVLTYIIALGAAQTGRTTGNKIRFLVDDSGGTLREIPIDSINGIGLESEEMDVTALQEAIKNVLLGTPECVIEITGPFDNSAAQAAGGSAAAPALSGSHTVLAPICGLNTPLTLDVRFGMRQYWETGEPQFGLTSSSTSGFLCKAYKVDGAEMKYSATFVVVGPTAPAWGTAAET